MACAAYFSGYGAGFDWGEEVTEDEAKTKWCPFANSRHVDWYKTDMKANTSVTMQTNFLIDGGVTVNCVGSACMAWRYTWPAGGHLSDAQITDEKLAISRGETLRPFDGYCGLAGKP